MKSFFIEFCKKTQSEPKLITMINIDSFLKNAQPYFKLVSKMNDDNNISLYENYASGYLFMKFLSNLIFYGDHELRSNTFKLVKSTLKYHVGNPLVYIFLVFSILQRDLTSAYQFDYLSHISNIKIFDFLLNLLIMHECRTSGSEIIHILDVLIHLIEIHFQAIFEMIKEMKIQKEQDHAYSITQKNKDVSKPSKVASNKYDEDNIIGRETYKLRFSDQGTRRRANSYSTGDQMEKAVEVTSDPLNQNGILSETSLTLENTKEKVVSPP